MHSGTLHNTSHRFKLSLLYPSHIIPLVNCKKENENLNAIIFSLGPLSFGQIFKTLYFETATCEPVRHLQITPVSLSCSLDKWARIQCFVLIFAQLFVNSLKVKEYFLHIARYCIFCQIFDKQGSLESGAHLQHCVPNCQTNKWPIVDGQLLNQ